MGREAKNMTKTAYLPALYPTCMLLKCATIVVERPRDAYFIKSRSVTDHDHPVHSSSVM